MIRETDLYAPVKQLLESLNYQVKAEVKDCDVVGLRDDQMVIVELKLSFSIDLLLQAVQRQSLSDLIYMAIPAPDTPTKRKNWRARQRGYLKLCRMLGLGLILVKSEEKTEILLDPTEYKPRRNKRKTTALLKEFNQRLGDPNVGGTTGKKIITAYRQDALRCALALAGKERMKLSDIRKEAGVEKASSILQKNYYHWFERLDRGVYGLTDLGREELKKYDDVIKIMQS
ncbi:DUF2161 family putative PD-(D/E)XK-type phosphodiesterase [Terasakiella sp. A23]|uniref:DUF2161 domain-containing phosphodiesterase n=1 Tax=Terasakiella sp. FCG-A23 TaxID=3080561 RepID=UPI0029555D32|nr:DUF2161 family putative PD-(D/E)XK-type phosphodiesterase [Terasakiella sp. A23]MDV7340761.1 DUF2161 family putative PD-(D/E)XK-type phosphodiesterase [Terasakiella sp. A23]